MKLRFAIACLAAASLNAATLNVPQGHVDIQNAIIAAKPGDTVPRRSGGHRGPMEVTLKSAGNDDKGKLGLKRAEATTLEGGVEMAEKSVLDGFTVTGISKYDITTSSGSIALNSRAASRSARPSAQQARRASQ